MSLEIWVLPFGIDFDGARKTNLLENPQIQPNLENEDYIVGRLLRPEARKDIIELLEKLEIKPTSMMDISDGLSSDVLHLCKQSELGCRIYEEKFLLTRRAKPLHLSLA